MSQVAWKLRLCGWVVEVDEQTLESCHITTVPTATYKCSCDLYNSNIYVQECVIA
jgi:uncharacterized protein YlaI